MTFLDLLSDDPVRNQTAWVRSPANPVIPYGADWCRDFIAPSSMLADGGRLTLYVEGGAGDRECIGRFTASLDVGLRAAWVADAANPLLEPSVEGFDQGSVFDPAGVRLRDGVHVYYSATRGGAHAFAEGAQGGCGDVGQAPDDESIGHAKVTGGALVRDPAPVMWGRCPNVIEWREALYLFHVQVVAGGYRIFGSRSLDGRAFEPLSTEPLIDVGAAGEWDCFTVTTPKVFADGGGFVMLYAGDDRRLDDPTGIGVATSEDLVHWTRHPGNPILRSGAAGSFDGFSVASAVPYLVAGGWHMLYAGTAAPVAEGLHSQIGAVRLQGA